MFIFLCVIVYRFDQPEDRRSESREQGTSAASIGFFLNVRTFVATLGGFSLDALRREFANVLRMLVLALFV